MDFLEESDVFSMIGGNPYEESDDYVSDNHYMYGGDDGSGQNMSSDRNILSDIDTNLLYYITYLFDPANREKIQTPGFEKIKSILPTSLTEAQRNLITKNKFLTFKPSELKEKLTNLFPKELQLLDEKVKGIENLKQMYIDDNTYLIDGEHENKYRCKSYGDKIKSPSLDNLKNGRFLCDQLHEYNTTEGSDGYGCCIKKTKLIFKRAVNATLAVNKIYAIAFLPPISVVNETVEKFKKFAIENEKFNKLEKQAFDSFLDQYSNDTARIEYVEAATNPGTNIQYSNNQDNSDSIMRGGNSRGKNIEKCVQYEIKQLLKEEYEQEVELINNNMKLSSKEKKKQITTLYDDIAEKIGLLCNNCLVSEYDVKKCENMLIDNLHSNPSFLNDEYIYHTSHSRYNMKGGAPGHMAQIHVLHKYASEFMTYSTQEIQDISEQIQDMSDGIKVDNMVDIAWEYLVANKSGEKFVQITKEGTPDLFGGSTENEEIIVITDDPTSESKIKDILRSYMNDKVHNGDSVNTGWGIIEAFGRGETVDNKWIYQISYIKDIATILEKIVTQLDGFPSDGLRQLMGGEIQGKVTDVDMTKLKTFNKDISSLITDIDEFNKQKKELIYDENGMIYKAISIEGLQDSNVIFAGITPQLDSLKQYIEKLIGIANVIVTLYKFSEPNTVQVFYSNNESNKPDDFVFSVDSLTEIDEWKNDDLGRNVDSARNQSGAIVEAVSNVVSGVKSTFSAMLNINKEPEPDDIINKNIRGNINWYKLQLLYYFVRLVKIKNITTFTLFCTTFFENSMNIETYLESKNKDDVDDTIEKIIKELIKYDVTAIYTAEKEKLNISDSDNINTDNINTDTMNAIIDHLYKIHFIDVFIFKPRKIRMNNTLMKTVNNSVDHSVDNVKNQINKLSVNGSNVTKAADGVIGIENIPQTSEESNSIADLISLPGSDIYNNSVNGSQKGGPDETSNTEKGSEKGPEETDSQQNINNNDKLITIMNELKKSDDKKNKVTLITLEIILNKGLDETAISYQYNKTYNLFMNKEFIYKVAALKQLYKDSSSYMPTYLSLSSSVSPLPPPVLNSIFNYYNNSRVFKKVEVQVDNLTYSLKEWNDSAKGFASRAQRSMMAILSDKKFAGTLAGTMSAEINSKMIKGIGEYLKLNTGEINTERMELIQKNSMVKSWSDLSKDTAQFSWIILKEGINSLNDLLQQALIWLSCHPTVMRLVIKAISSMQRDLCNTVKLKIGEFTDGKGLGDVNYVGNILSSVGVGSYGSIDSSHTYGKGKRSAEVQKEWLNENRDTYLQYLKPIYDKDPSALPYGWTEVPPVVQGGIVKYSNKNGIELGATDFNKPQWPRGIQDVKVDDTVKNPEEIKEEEAFLDNYQKIQAGKISPSNTIDWLEENRFGKYQKDKREATINVVRFFTDIFISNPKISKILDVVQAFLEGVPLLGKYTGAFIAIVSASKDELFDELTSVQTLQKVNLEFMEVVLGSVECFRPIQIQQFITIRIDNSLNEFMKKAETIELIKKAEKYQEQGKDWTSWFKSWGATVVNLLQKHKQINNILETDIIDFMRVGIITKDNIIGETGQVKDFYISNIDKDIVETDNSEQIKKLYQNYIEDKVKKYDEIVNEDEKLKIYAKFMDYLYILDGSGKADNMYYSSDLGNTNKEQSSRGGNKQKKSVRRKYKKTKKKRNIYIERVN